jgi:hypothetical protein
MRFILFLSGLEIKIASGVLHHLNCKKCMGQYTSRQGKFPEENKGGIASALFDRTSAK